MSLQIGVEDYFDFFLLLIFPLEVSKTVVVIHLLFIPTDESCFDLNLFIFAFNKNHISGG